MDNQILIYIGEILSWLVELLILIGCIILVLKNKNTPVKLMLVGMVVSILFSIIEAGAFVIQSNSLGIEKALYYKGIFSIIQVLGYGLFGWGLFLYGLKFKTQAQ